MISILIADDHKLIRETWTYILNSDSRFKVIGSCSNSEDAVKMSKQKHPECGADGYQYGSFFGHRSYPPDQGSFPTTFVIGVTMHSQPSYAKKMLQQGASGYVTKNSSRKKCSMRLLKYPKEINILCEEIKELISESNLRSDHPFSHQFTY